MMGRAFAAIAAALLVLGAVTASSGQAPPFGPDAVAPEPPDGPPAPDPLDPKSNLEPPDETDEMLDDAPYVPRPRPDTDDEMADDVDEEAPDDEPGIIPDDAGETETDDSLFEGLDSDSFLDDCASCDSCCEMPVCGSVERVWARADFLLWWSKGSHSPALITTGPNSSGGVLGANGTQVVFGGDRLGTGTRYGGRTDFGIWLDEEKGVGIGGSFLGLTTATSPYLARSEASNGTPLLARPFYDVTTGLPSSQVVAQQNLLTGGINVRSTNDFLLADAYVRETLLGRCQERLEFFYGYRFARMDEALDIYDQSVVVDGGGLVPIGTTIDSADLFRTQNTFHGGLLGLGAEIHRGKVTVMMAGKVALGDMRQEVTIGGQSITTVPGVGTASRFGSLYAQPTNIGKYARDNFAVIPEATMNINYALTDRWSASVGYSFLYLNNVMQAAYQVDTSINPTQISGPLVGEAAPVFNFRRTDYWLHGVNFGLECRF